jgi:hypothetical protein
MPNMHLYCARRPTAPQGIGGVQLIQGMGKFPEVMSEERHLVGGIYVEP